MPPQREPASGRFVCFGSFEVDLEEGNLRKLGRRIRLQEQPFRILVLLLKRPGQLVTRDEVRQELWSEDTFVEFDAALNTAVRKVREALNDSADNPRFLETVHGRGYRFVAPVAGREVQAGVSIQPRPVRRSYVWLATGLILAGAAVGALSLRYRYSGPPITPEETVVLADFANHTGDPVFDDTLNTGLSVSLRQSPFLNVLSDSDVASTLQQMMRPADTKLTPDVAQEVCQRARSKAYLVGSISGLGSQYVLSLKAVNCRSGDTLAEEQVTSATKEKVLDSLGKAASELRGELGESLATMQKFDVPLEQATTSSLEALKAYSLGKRTFKEIGPAAALPYHQRSAELDPNFASNYAALGNDYNGLSQPGRAREYYTRAFQLRDHVGEHERWAISARYYLNVTGELDKTAQTYEEEIRNYPRESGAHLNLGAVYAAQGRPELAVESYRQSLRLAPDNIAPYGDLVLALLSLQRFDETRKTVNEAQAKGLDTYILHNGLYALAFLGSDSAAMAEQQQWYAGKPDYESFGLALASDTEAYRGHLRKGRELTKRAVDSAVRVDGKEAAAIWQVNAALEQAAYGNYGEARQSAAEALKLAPASQGVESEAALAFAMAGETARAELLAQDLGRRYPLDTQMQSLWLPAIRAQLALDRRKPAFALNALRTASSIEFGNIPFGNNVSCLYPVYIRGEAYLASGRGSAAAAEFQKIIDHTGTVWNCWTGALAHLGVARGNALQAGTSQNANADAARTRALAAYNDFLILWEDADADVPILKQAKAECGKLQSR